MRYLKYAVLLGLLAFSVGKANAQVAVSIGIGTRYVGPPPVCSYGYFPTYPYTCAPYGYYGPRYFVGGIFIGAGPWFHGFRDRRFFDRDDFWRGERFRDENRFRGEDRFRGDRGRNEFRGGRDFRGDARFRDGNSFRGGNRFQGGGFRGANGFHGGGRGHGRGHR